MCRINIELNQLVMPDDLRSIAHDCQSIGGAAANVLHSIEIFVREEVWFVIFSPFQVNVEKHPMDKYCFMLVLTCTLRFDEVITL